MTNEQKTAELYRVAYSCEQHKARGCPRVACNKCPFCILGYVSMYTVDQGEAMLIQTSASIDFQRHEARRRAQVASRIGTIITIISLCLWVRSCVKSPPKDLVNGAVPQATIDKIQRERKETARVVQDFNNDGKINCIDYAIIFCIRYPGARIILNNNPRTGMNHLFNYVPGPNGTWIAVEPQPSVGNKYQMKDVWGSKYDPSVDLDHTKLYMQKEIDGLRMQRQVVRTQDNYDYCDKYIQLCYDRINGK